MGARGCDVKPGVERRALLNRFGRPGQMIGTDLAA
jgi:hypothetical protein